MIVVSLAIDIVVTKYIRKEEKDATESLMQKSEVDS